MMDNQQLKIQDMSLWSLRIVYNVDIDVVVG